MYVGRNNRLRALIVVYRPNPSKVYLYALGDDFRSGVCCLIAKHPSPGTAIAAHIKQYPVSQYLA